MACNLLFRLDNIQLSLVAVSSKICFIQSLTFAQLIFCREVWSVRQYIGPSNIRSHGRAYFQRHCNVPDCDP